MVATLPVTRAPVTSNNFPRRKPYHRSRNKTAKVSLRSEFPLLNNRLIKVFGGNIQTLLVLQDYCLIRGVSQQDCQIRPTDTQDPQSDLVLFVLISSEDDRPWSLLRNQAIRLGLHTKAMPGNIPESPSWLANRLQNFQEKMGEDQHDHRGISSIEAYLS